MEKQINNLRNEVAEQPLISSVAPLPFYANDTYTHDTPKPAKPLPMGVAEEDVSSWQSLTNIYTYAKIGIVLMPSIVKLFFGVIMKNWKTTLGAIIAAIATLLNMTGIVTIPADVQTGLLAVALFIVGIFSSDAKKEE